MFIELALEERTNVVDIKQRTTPPRSERALAVERTVTEAPSAKAVHKLTVDALALFVDTHAHHLLHERLACVGIGRVRGVVLHHLVQLARAIAFGRFQLVEHGLTAQRMGRGSPLPGVARGAARKEAPG